MELPKIPANEKERQAALEKLNILDTPLQENFERITRITKALFNVPVVSFTIIDKDRQWFKSSDGMDVCKTHRDFSFCAHAINQDDVFIIEDTLQDKRFADNPAVIGSPYVRFYAGYPVRASGGEKIGTLCVADTKPRQFSEKEMIELKDMAGLIEAELNNKQEKTIQQQLTEELVQAKKQAYVDGLTQLWNRSGIEELLKKQKVLAQENKQDFGVALIDIDNFKGVNDTYGHNAGDAILRGVAKRLIAGYKDTHCVGRWGGEEFLVIMDNDDLNTLFRDADRARSIVSSTPILFENLEITITITTGLSAYKWQENSEITSIIGNADQALYEGKRDGKNVVKISLAIKERDKDK